MKMRLSGLETMRAWGFVMVVGCRLGAVAAPRLDIKFDDERGGVRSVAVADDPDRMNWVEGLGEWGTPAPSMRLSFVGAKSSGGSQTAVWTNRFLRLDVLREVCGDALDERYVFTAVSHCPVYFKRGDVGLYATFNDNYEDALTSQRKRCHAHIWCGGAFGGVRALKMGPSPTELGLFLTEGTLDAYSVRRIRSQSSNDRGDFILHPEPFHLNPGESKAIAWRLTAYPEGGFRAAALASRVMVGEARIVILTGLLVVVDEESPVERTLLVVTLVLSEDCLDPTSDNCPKIVRDIAFRPMATPIQLEDEIGLSAKVGTKVQRHARP